MKKNNILILGADGMVGRTLFLSLNTIFPKHVWGTSRNKDRLSNNKLFFSVENHQRDFIQIKKVIPYLDYIINCIAILNDTDDIKNVITINSLFPHILEEFAEKNNSKLIHISTDGVFSPTSKTVVENSVISPTDNYGLSKALGETTSKNALTFRSSFIGLDPTHHRGLLEKIKLKRISSGYTNQQWTGCTTLQFAQLCSKIIANNSFDELRRDSSLYHFTPLGPISKYTIIKRFAYILDKKYHVKKTTGKKISRKFMTNFFDSLSMNEYTNDIAEAMKNLIAFEKQQVTN